MEEISKNQIDKLGQRLKEGYPTAADLTMLNEYGESFGKAYEEFIEIIRNKLNLVPTERLRKSNQSIIDKLKRISIQLSQIQDIVGCRLVVPDISAQNELTNLLKNTFSSVTIKDRRIQPSHGYRAIHIIVKHFGKLIEIQIRTELQHTWAQLSEKWADEFDPTIKYGGGDKEKQTNLNSLSQAIKMIEESEEELSNLPVNAISNLLQNMPQNILISDTTNPYTVIKKILIHTIRGIMGYSKNTHRE